MARQSDDCWRCGTLWSTEASPLTKLHVLPGGAVAPKARDDAKAADADRWANDGGSWASKHAVIPAVAGTR